MRGYVSEGNMGASSSRSRRRDDRDVSSYNETPVLRVRSPERSSSDVRILHGLRRSPSVDPASLESFLMRINNAGRDRRQGKQSSRWNEKKLKQMLKSRKLAPKVEGEDDATDGAAEECPICMLYYPALNHSKCCKQQICTGCFVEMKEQNCGGDYRCPFCNNVPHKVRYLGEVSEDERSRRKEEEERVEELKRKAIEEDEESRRTSRDTGDQGDTPEEAQRRRMEELFGRDYDRQPDPSEISADVPDPDANHPLFRLLLRRREHLARPTGRRRIGLELPDNSNNRIVLGNNSTIGTEDYIPSSLLNQSHGTAGEDLDELMLNEAIMQSLAINIPSAAPEAPAAPAAPNPPAPIRSWSTEALDPDEAELSRPIRFSQFRRGGIAPAGESSVSLVSNIPPPPPPAAPPAVLPTNFLLFESTSDEEDSHDESDSAESS